MSETTTDSMSSADQVRQTLSGRHVCPYCGLQYPGGPEPCPRCTMEDSPATRQATKSRIGPWYVLQSRNPAAPGMKYATLLALINKGQVTPRSILRGPTTYQLWRFAAHVRGVSREFGLCYSCGGPIDRLNVVCPHCQRSQEAPHDPDTLLESRNGNANGNGIPVERSIEPTHHAAEQEVTTIPPPSDRLRHQMNHRHGSRVVSAMSLASAFQDEKSVALDGSRGRKLKVIFSLIVLLAAATAGLFYFKPEYRQPTRDWFANTWATAKDKFENLGNTPPPLNQKSLQQPVVITPVLPAPAPQPPVIVQHDEPQPKQEQQPAPQPVDSATALNQARDLWRKAITAEGNSDFAGAAKLYEQIKQLPSEDWPAGLDLRLQLAQRQAGQSSAQ